MSEYTFKFSVAEFKKSKKKTSENQVSLSPIYLNCYFNMWLTLKNWDSQHFPLKSFKSNILFMIRGYLNLGRPLFQVQNSHIWPVVIIQDSTDFRYTPNYKDWLGTIEKWWGVFTVSLIFCFKFTMKTSAL